MRSTLSFHSIDIECFRDKELCLNFVRHTHTHRESSVDGAYMHTTFDVTFECKCKAHPRVHIDLIFKQRIVHP